MEPHKDLVKGHEFWMLPVEGGIFFMGDEHGDRHKGCRPSHQVRLTDYYIGKFPVTNALWSAVVNAPNVGLDKSHFGSTLNPYPSNFQGEDVPVEQISWYDVQAFLKKLNNRTEYSRPKGHLYRLPTEAEWEYVARGGKYYEEGYKYAGSDRLKDVGWFDENSSKETKPVGLKHPNQLGIFDLSGNVCEWCQDWYEGLYYNQCKRKGEIEKPNGPSKGTNRVSRGGSWREGEQYTRVAWRTPYGPEFRSDHLGFRLVLAPQ